MITREDINKPASGFSDSLRKPSKKPTASTTHAVLSETFDAFLRGKSEEIQRLCKVHRLRADATRRHPDTLADYLEKLASDIRKTKKDEAGAMITLSALIGYLNHYA